MTADDAEIRELAREIAELSFDLSIVRKDQLIVRIESKIREFLRKER